jgi:tRNA (adenine22-N1)-methyltransferase
MKLDARLRMIADSVPRCRILADVGTDHAYIPIAAVMTGSCGKALAADLRPGPLKSAQANIIKYGLGSFIETRLGDGLKPIDDTECDVIVIAGMGGPLIRKILSESYDKAKRANKLLLQPNNAADALRRWLYENGFDITGEKLCEEGRKLYCLMEAKWTGIADVKDEFAYYIGVKIFENNDLLLKKYLTKKLIELNKIILGRSRSDPVKIRRIEDETAMDTRTCIEIRDRLQAFLKAE